LAGVGRKPTDQLGLSDAKKETFLDRNWTASVDTNAANRLPARRVRDHDALKDGPRIARLVLCTRFAVLVFVAHSSCSPTTHQRRTIATSADSVPAACPPAVAAALVHIAGAIRQHLRQVRSSDGRSLPGAFARALLA
jgi:hypothetical protein